MGIPQVPLAKLLFCGKDFFTFIFRLQVNVTKRKENYLTLVLILKF